MILCRHPQTIILVINFIYQKMDSLVHEKKETFRVSTYHKLWCSFVINKCDMLLFTSQVKFTLAFIKFALSKLVKDKNHSFFSNICLVIIKLCYSGTCLIRHSFGQEKCVCLPNCRIRRVKMHSKTLICVERFCRIQKIPDYTGVGFDRFHCICYFGAFGVDLAMF